MDKVKILIVENEGIVAKSIQDMLNHLGYDVPGIAASGKIAIQKAEETQPDLILMDIRLRGEMDGIEAARTIRKKYDIPVIYLTAYADKRTLQRAKITEPFGYILKPFEERDLHSSIEMALYKNKMDKKLKEREHWFSTVLKSIGDAVIATDQEGTVTFMNSVAEKLTGWEKIKALGKNLEDSFDFMLGKDKSSQKGMSLANANPQTNIPSSYQATLINKKHAEIPIDYSDSPIMDEKRSILGNVLVFRDVTERRLAQQQLQQSYQKLRSTLDETVYALASAVEMKDPYTAGHQERVAKLACTIADELGLTDDQIDGIRMAGIIHDIGKIYIPAEILTKPTQLESAEIALIKRHPEVGHEILKGIDFPWPIAKIVLQHHESMLGDGYPAGLRGEDILLEARIIAVSDVVEAMSSHRPYRAALGVEITLEEIRRNRGILYDPMVVDVCLDLFMKKGYKFGVDKRRESLLFVSREEIEE